MKTKLFIIIFTFLYCAIFGQSNNATKITINGLEILRTYTNSQIFSALGNPDIILPPELGDVDPNDYEYRYIANNGLTNDFSFSSEVFIGFVLRSSSFSLNNFIKVGDNLSKLSQMGGGITSGDGNIKYWKPNTNDDRFADISVVFHYNNTNIITQIALTVPL